MVDVLTEARKGAQALVNTCASLKSGEGVLILSDPTTEEVGRIVAEIAREITPEVKHLCLSVSKIHGTEPPDEIAGEMLKSDVIFCLTSRSLAHTSARKNATDKGARFLSLPDYSLEALASPALRVDYEAQALLCDQIAEIFDQGETVKITSESGTNARLGISGRKANSCPGLCAEPGCFASPPDIETHIPPLEECSDGIVVVDGSIPCPEIGVLKTPVTLTIEGGKIRKFEGEKASVLEEIFRSQNNEKAYVIAELGVGLNPAAHLFGRMLEDEGCIGTIHLGCGSNSTFGGNNKINFHLDMVIKDITLMVDKTEVIAGGRLCL
jgi:aminopeptidase